MNLMNITIETLSSLEVSVFYPVFEEIIKQEFPGYTTPVIDYLLHEMYTQPNIIYWTENHLKTVYLAKTIKGQIVGFAMVDKPYGGVSLLRWLGVVNSYQKNGIGTKLLQHWINNAQNQNCHKAEVAAQEKAKGFYEKAGLVFEGKRQASYFGIDQYMFGKVMGKPNDTTMTT